MLSLTHPTFSGLPGNQTTAAMMDSNQLPKTYHTLTSGKPSDYHLITESVASGKQ